MLKNLIFNGEVDSNTEESLNSGVNSSSTKSPKKQDLKTIMSISVVLNDFKVKLFTSTNNGYLEPVFILLKTKNIVLKNDKKFSLYFMKAITLHTGKLPSSGKTIVRREMSGDSVQHKRMINSRVSQETKKNADNIENLEGELIFEIQTKETGNVLAFEDKKMIFWMYSVELNASPENLENITVFT